jgi:hypothetical protein
MRKVSFLIVLMSFLLSCENNEQNNFSLKIGTVKSNHSITSDELNVLNYLKIDGVLSKDSTVVRFFDLALISEEEFLEKKKKSINLISTDSVYIEKIKGVISLPLDHGICKIKDNVDDEVEMKEYDFSGFLETLNGYLINGTYWEHWDYFIIDKINGKETYRFSGVPYIDADKRLIITARENPYDLTGEFKLYNLSDTLFEPKMEFEFKYWMPISDSKVNDFFWDKKGWFYLRVNHIENYWDDEGNINEENQCIKLRKKQ